MKWRVTYKLSRYTDPNTLEFFARDFEDASEKASIAIELAYSEDISFEIIGLNRM